MFELTLARVINRFQTVTFDVSQDATIHGFIGTFESVLYDDVIISIVPKVFLFVRLFKIEIGYNNNYVQSFSTGMFSWFPLYIPLCTPVFVRKGENISASFWRWFSRVLGFVVALICI